MLPAMFGHRLARLGWGLALVLACSKDAVEPEEHSKAEEKKTEAAEPDMGDMLRLEEREFPLLIWAVYLAQQDYFDKGRLAPHAQLRSAVEDLGLHTPEFFGEVRDGELLVTVRSATRQFSLAQVDDVMKAADVLEQVLAFTQSTLDLEDEPLHELEYAAINGFLAPLDPHTILLTPEQHADLGVKTRGSFGGIGAEIRPADRRILIVRVLPGSPAEKHGLQAGDVVLEIGGQSTVNLTADDASELIRGPVGTKVELRIRRLDQTLTLEVTRDTIKIESVRATMLPDRVGYLSISAFQKDTAAKVEGAVTEMIEAGELAGLVIDVRGNSGGLLTQAAGILDQMATEAELVIVHSAQGRESEVATDKLVLPESTAVVVLVDEQSASASEILAGSVKHLERGLVIGRGSFGKGTVQMLKEATPYGRELALKLTVAEYRVTGDRKIQGVGVRPHLELVPVRLSEHQDIAAYYDDERFERERERAKTAHLPSSIHDDGANAFVGKDPPKLRFLDAPPASTRAQEVADDGAPEELRDPEIRIAHELARALAGKRGPDQMQSALGQLVEKLSASEDARIAEALAERELDWKSAPELGIEASLRVEVSLEGPSPLPAGEPFMLRVAVTNEGEAAAPRVHAITDCDQDELDGIEILFGRVEPGATVRRSLRLHLMPWRSRLSDQLRVAVHAGEPAAAPDGEGHVELDVVAVPRPRFAFDYWIVDDPKLAGAAPKRPKGPPIPGESPFAIAGNGDGVLQPGERVLLAFEVRNDGPGEARETRAILRNLSGTQGLLEEGVVELGKLGAGKRARGAFGIEISPKADPAQPLELDLAIGDAYARESAQHKMRLRVVQSRPGFVAQKTKFRVGGEGTRAYNGADPSTAVVAQLDAGARVDAVGHAGEWVAVSLLGGRRAWIPSDRLQPGNGARAELERAGLIVDPPQVSIDAVPVRVFADHVVVTGSAQHPRRVRDVVVRVKPDANGKRERKVYYLANPQREGEGARELAFSTKVPLEPGNNRIVVIVRDGDKVERRVDLLVRRD